MKSPASFAALILTAVFAAPPPAAAAQSPELALRVMTFNLRYASEQPPNAWPDRLPVAANLIRRRAPDLAGTQEGLYGQLKDLARALPEYDWIGEGREGGSGGEFMAVFFRKERFEPLAYGHFWLSDTPKTIGSRTWGNGVIRMVTWVRFREKASGAEFHFVNTHFDHQNENSRVKSAQLLLERIRSFKPRLPVIVTGDFNQKEGSDSHKILLEPAEGQVNLTDSAMAAPARTGEQIGTFHGFRGVHPGDERIDWILFSPPFRALSVETVADQENGQYPSDHFPVESVLSASVEAIKAGPVPPAASAPAPANP